jgi:hypothetical protein
MVEGNGIKNYCIEVPLNGITSLPNNEDLPCSSKVISGDKQTD